MNDRTRFIAGGAAIGAVIGAIAGLIAARMQTDPQTGDPSASLPAQFRELDGGTVFRLGVSVVGVVRQVLELF